MTDDRGEHARWDRIDEIFGRAVALSGEARERLLEEACAGDPGLRSEVEALCRAVEEAEGAGFLTRPAEVVWEPLVSGVEGRRRRVGSRRRPEGRVGQRFGPWEAEAELASGGMSTVYRARRADGAFDQQVALKVIRPGLASERLIRRFVTERQILAQLEHPAIARLLDGGSTDDGLPYLVMEFVDGEPITAYCDRHGLGVEERLRLFLKVADAVHHAHRNLVLHRDLKPSNILVTRAGQVKLLDFGIAKLLDPASGTGEPTLTRPGLRPLTPDYASPEQIRGEALTTASDVYQLGVLLYRLLAGRAPYRLKPDSAPALAAALEATDPEPPSVRACEMTAIGDGEPSPSADELARSRSTTPNRLRRRLQGDLDTIVLKAMRKEPERRYASAEGLAEDVHRHLAGHPISARPDRWSYRARKLLSRHPWLVPVAAALLLLAGGYVWLTGRHTAALERERNHARAEAARATQIRDLLVTVFEGSDPERTLGDTVTARTLLERGARRVDSVLNGQPELRAEMLGVIGSIMTSLGFYDRAEAVLERAVDLNRQAHGPGHVGAAEPLLDLGDIHYELDAYREGERFYRQALGIYRDTFGPRDSALLRPLRSLGRLYYQRNVDDSAERYLDEARRVATDDGSGDRANEARLLADQASFHYHRREWDEAERLYREALEIRRRLYGTADPEVLAMLLELGRTNHYQGDIPEAHRVFRQALDLHTKVYGRGHPKTLRSAYFLFISLHKAGVGSEEELDLLRDNAAAAREWWSPEHRMAGEWEHRLGSWLLRHGRPAESEPALRRAEGIFAAEYGESAEETVAVRVQLGRALLEQGAPEANEWVERAFSETEALRPLKPISMSRTDPALRVVIRLMADHLEAGGDVRGAERWRALLQ